jgi:ribosomal protein S18 acetylase RimI-like enzyme
MTTRAATTITLRSARPEDGARCQAIAVAAWEPIHAWRRQALGAEIYEHLHPEGAQAKAPQIAAAFARNLDCIVVAETPEGEVAGFVTYHLDPIHSVGEIGNNAVDPAWQGHGIATRLYRDVLERFRVAGMLVARVTTGLDDGHAPARAAYAKVGFTAAAPSVTLYQKL